MKLNDNNFFGKRTATQVKAITKQIFPAAEVQNWGDGRLFSVYVEDTIKNRIALKSLGFILCRGNAGDKSIKIKTH